MARHPSIVSNYLKNILETTGRVPNLLRGKGLLYLEGHRLDRTQRYFKGEYSVRFIDLSPHRLACQGEQYAYHCEAPEREMRMS